MRAFLESVSLYGSPDFLIADNQFNFLNERYKILSTPSNHPQANGVLERFHKELGNMSRIHQCAPTQAVNVLKDKSNENSILQWIKAPSIWTSK